MKNLKLLAYTANQIFAKGLQALLEPGIQVLAVSPSAGKLVALTEAFEPDILLLDELRADLSGLSAVSRRFPAVKIIAWINSDSPELSMQLMEAGAVALLQNNCAEQELIDCIDSVVKGEPFIPAGLQTAMWTSRRCKITPREGELMLRISQGLTNKEIAWQLKITEGTVKVYLSRLFTKLGVTDRYELALVTLRNGATLSRQPSQTGMETSLNFPPTVPTAVFMSTH